MTLVVIASPIESISWQDIARKSASRTSTMLLQSLQGCTKKAEQVAVAGYFTAIGLAVVVAEAGESRNDPAEHQRAGYQVRSHNL